MQSIVNGEILALKQAGGRAHGRRSASLAQRRAAQNGHGTARSLAPRQDLDAIAYVGDYDSAATAISLPIINANDILPGQAPAPLHRLTDATRFDRR